MLIHFVLFLKKSKKEQLYLFICLICLRTVNTKSIKKYPSKKGQKTGKSNSQLNVQNKLITAATVHLCQNLNSFIERMRGPFSIQPPSSSAEIGFYESVFVEWIGNEPISSSSSSMSGNP
ncbi:hypothetical protein TTHERM_000392949 (macronuclear) [Tetrahymena thermophila SB210]|uniref:Uncharacterized protein n=1 Tax=Tetrahymena thermophila (strain SB210) TaxID=312017 RepID=W7X7Y0_TETTS|nr:hypothetical protein TTHERM_000392949 [Tetrahymena thermophila SB210]EWS75490.1 hypothetical protein TTHERM_000392949 [Tetrahymena thermophila SB210]|eukprot:XP_012651959.1 hypothetical protein TTHERM_000392949 [Tetrahymena thermophila SB210]